MPAFTAVTQRFASPSLLLLAGLALCAAAAVQHFWLAQLINRMPASGTDEVTFPATIRSRETPTGEWTTTTISSRRVDRTLLASGRHVVIQGDLTWTKDDGTPTFESTGIYGVDRHTRRNLPGYGNVERTGAFLFPLHTERRDHAYWDPVFIGPRSASFDRDETISGLPVLKFRFVARELDETSGFLHLPDVPERYNAHSNGAGWLWIEPVSGIVVDYEETGTSFFVDPKTGRRIADFYHWSDRYDGATRAAKLKQAIDARSRIVATETGIPAVLLLLGVPCLLLGWRQRPAKAHGPGAQPDPRQ